MAVVASSGAAAAAPTLRTNTAYVEDLASDGQLLWAATRGGLEAYDLATLERRALFTAEDGLSGTWARKVRIVDGEVEVENDRARCRRLGARIVCMPLRDPIPVVPVAAPTAHGRRVTTTLEVGGRRFVGTAGDGLWLEGERARRITPVGSICANHVVAIAEHRGVVYLGGFDDGLCRRVGDRYEAVDAPFRMVNRLLSTPRGLIIAANEGLFLSTDGRTFRRLLDPIEGWNGLALDGTTLWATTAVALYRFTVTERALRVRATWDRPGGSTALQGVTVAGGAVWLASEDRGVLRARGRKVLFLDRAAGMPSSWVVDVAAADEFVYAATLRDGLVRLDPRDEMTRPERVAGAFPWLLHLAVDGQTLWIGAQGGAMRLVPGSDQAASLFVPALDRSNVYAAAHIGETILLGTESGLLTIDAP
jgi:ligand-binding sensor domain-containing protein